MLHNLPPITRLSNLPKKFLLSLAFTALAGCTNVAQLKTTTETPTNPASPKEKSEQTDMNYFEKTAKLCNVDTSEYEAIYQSVLKEFANDKNFNYFLNSLSSIEEKRGYVFSIGSLSGNTYFERKRTFTKRWRNYSDL